MEHEPTKVVQYFYNEEEAQTAVKENDQWYYIGQGYGLCSLKEMYAVCTYDRKKEICG